jgi:zinc and cadmium transporter
MVGPMIWLWVALVVALDGAAGLAGALLPERWLERYRAPMLGFAAGALLASGLGELLPDAVARRGPSVLVWSVAAIATLIAAEWATARRRRHREHPVVPIALLGADTLHNIGDGIVIASAFLASTRVGVVTSVAVLVHELPEEIADFALLRAAGLARRTALLALAAVQLTAGIGAAATLLASSLAASAEGVILAIAGGTFLHIAAIDLLPDMLRERRVPVFVAFAIGMGCVLIAS